MSNVKYRFSEDGLVAYGELASGQIFVIDADMVEKIRTVKFYLGSKGNGSQYYVIDCKGRTLHDDLFEHRPGYEHQQNQMNQPLQKNNTSGVSGVSYYPPRRKFRARIKICQQEIHLGYFDTFEDAVKARNIGMLCMFGQYGRYNDTGKAPDWIERKVAGKCARYAELSQNSAFFDFWDGGVVNAP